LSIEGKIRKLAKGCVGVGEGGGGGNIEGKVDETVDWATN
jgi:hypothetical protein